MSDSIYCQTAISTAVAKLSPSEVITQFKESQKQSLISDSIYCQIAISTAEASLSLSEVIAHLKKVRTNV